MSVAVGFLQKLRPRGPWALTANRHAKGFRGESVELDAVDPARLRGLVRKAITQHINERALKIARFAEESERQLLESLTRQAADGVS